MISILMPFKNERKHLPELMKSLLSQSYQDFELIAIDDHSDDGSKEFLDSFNDLRIRTYLNKGHGIIDALRHALQYCKGSYITRQDADDIMPLKKLESLRDHLIKFGPKTIVTGQVKYFSEQSLGEGHKKYEAWLNQVCEESHFKKQIFKECTVCSSNWMAYLSDFKKWNFFENLTYPEDYHLVFKWLESNFQIKALSEITHLWRDHPQRASRNLEQYKDQKFYELKLDYLLKFHEGPFIVWGAGPKGKELVKLLNKRSIAFKWVSGNPKKVGKSIYGHSIHHTDELKSFAPSTILYCISQKLLLDRSELIGPHHNLVDFI
ncbi:MAG: glycosyltransferase family 2 protein [Bacteriovoracaceae bacterium]